MGYAADRGRSLHAPHFNGVVEGVNPSSSTQSTGSALAVSRRHQQCRPRFDEAQPAGLPRTSSDYDGNSTERRSVPPLPPNAEPCGVAKSSPSGTRGASAHKRSNR